MKIEGLNTLIKLLKEKHKKYAIMRVQLNYLSGLCIKPFEPNIKVYINSNKYSYEQIRKIEDYLIKYGIYDIKITEKYVEREKTNLTLFSGDKPRLHLGFENIKAIQLTEVKYIYPTLELTSDVNFNN